MNDAPMTEERLALIRNSHSLGSQWCDGCELVAEVDRRGDQIAELEAKVAAFPTLAEVLRVHRYEDSTTEIAKLFYGVRDA